MPKVAAVDFDGTLSEFAWPDIGEPKLDVINNVKELQNNGWEIILHTCRCGDKLQEAVDWCKEQGLIFDAVNENTKSMLEYWSSHGETCSPKPTADLYIDDRAIHVDEFAVLNIAKIFKIAS